MLHVLLSLLALSTSLVAAVPLSKQSLLIQEVQKPTFKHGPTPDVASDDDAPLVNFQVAQPPVLPAAAKQCTVELIRHNFANSYYQPAILDYKPPTDCGEVGKWAGISLNYTATSNGTQYDRLSAVTFQNVEIWRTSTAEPSRGAGIIWTHLKDVSRYLPLFAKPGTLILDLNNIIDTSIGIDGEYDVTLSATFYASSASIPPAVTSSLIVPLSNLSPSQANYVSVPPALNTTVKLPRNTAQAFAEIYASGNGEEEFWYMNAPDQYIPSFPPQTTYGKGPMREVRLLVDGKLAGFALPYPVIFTGGILPSLWRPISAYGSFDQPTYSVDLTPFVPLLADGHDHVVSIDVVSTESDHAINGNWYVSGNIQVVLDPSDKPTTGSITSYSAPEFPTGTVSGTPPAASPSDADVDFTVKASHALRIEANITTGSGKQTHVVWQQQLSFSNVQHYADQANTQHLEQSSKGTSSSTHNDVIVLQDQFDYPLSVNYYTISGNGNSGWSAQVDHSYTRTELPSPLLTTTTIGTTQNSNGTRIKHNDVTTSTGTTSQVFQYSDAAGNTYTRDVSATNSQVTSDQQGGNLYHGGDVKNDNDDDDQPQPKIAAAKAAPVSTRSVAHELFTQRLGAKRTERRRDHATW
ncbi:hypothetical protein BOTBODRAFT_27248 [Botryobasidium botryosum FD-172 SS1]|uniref:Peptide N-acetyl-beta-D-glucosaminyl asparaginase amidase A N-terminal domain-containing protein n=1 Tax=Botryobasidium botryosum (strain FD-172 SS1) TaxID=930990 RepID=A0A067MW72_BOTB1|nr:hypothetical protein BOTBODRAFT_27248 [Botryobasidium botryosum FD-172 SS1]